MACGPGGVDGEDLRIGSDRDAGTASRVGDGSGDRTHAADRHVPVAGPATNDVIHEADVLDEGRIVDRGERADQPVGGGDARQHVVGHELPQHVAKWPCRQRIPHLVVTGTLAKGGCRHQRLQKRRPDPLRDRSDARIHPCPACPCRITRTHAARARRARRRVVTIDQQSTTGIRGRRRVGRVPAPGEANVESKVADDRPRNQGHQIGVARHVGGQTGKRLCRHGGAAHVVAFFKHQHPASGTREIRRRHQAVVSATDDDVVVLERRRHPRQFFFLRDSKKRSAIAPSAADTMIT
jgi:hypothetical protein